MEQQTYDLVIIGGGPAGLSAGIYAQRAGLRTVLLEKELPGGQVNEAPIIENYPGFSEISGIELANKMREHALGFGLQIQTVGVNKIGDVSGRKVLQTDNGNVETKAVIIATGAKPRRLDIKGEKEFLGRGVSYCATCDGPFFRNKVVVAIGGGDRSLKEALFLSNIASKVYVIHRRDKFRAEKINLDRLKTKGNVDFIMDSVVEEIKGDQKVSAVSVKNVQTGKIEDLTTDGAFVFIGIIPRNEFIDAKKDDHGFLITDPSLMTSLEGVFAAGDCRSKVLRQVATAVGEGAQAVASVEEYLHTR